MPFGASGYAVYSITQLKPAIGYAASPGAFVMEKFVGLTLAFEAAAAVAPAWLAWTNLPLAFFMNACFMPAETTYASSTYPMEPSVCVTAWATAVLPLPPIPVGHLSDLPTPTVVFQSGETLAR